MQNQRCNCGRKATEYLILFGKAVCSMCKQQGQSSLSLKSFQMTEQQILSQLQKQQDNLSDSFHKFQGQIDRIIARCQQIKQLGLSFKQTYTRFQDKQLAKTLVQDLKIAKAVYNQDSGKGLKLYADLHKNLKFHIIQRRQKNESLNLTQSKANQKLIQVNRFLNQSLAFLRNFKPQSPNSFQFQQKVERVDRFDSSGDSSGWTFRNEGNDALKLKVIEVDLWMLGFVHFAISSQPQQVQLQIRLADKQRQLLKQTKIVKQKEYQNQFIINFNSPVRLFAGNVYEIQSKNLGEKFIGTHGTRPLKNSFISIQDSLKDTNGTSRKSGQFKAFLFSKVGSQIKL